ncbi:cysteine desulfurase [Planctomycetota bacterium]|nr:cysteine desulfurase [Planctomycetota bacterium]
MMTTTTARSTFDVEAIRKDFPILQRSMHGKPIAYLDNAATTQKPQQVIDAISSYYANTNANVHRSNYQLGAEATEAYEGAREKVRAFLNAESKKEVVFTRGTTEGINLVAQAYARPRLKAGDEVLISGLEHHSNIVPWQMVCEATGATLKVAEIDDTGTIRMDQFRELCGANTKVVAVNHISNSLGTINPVEEIIRLAHEAGAVVLIDGAQATSRVNIDVQALGADFYAFSGHKVYAPMGIGALYGRYDLLEDMAPYQGGGDMIRTVTFEKSTFSKPPTKYEAGTPNVAGAVGLGAALDYVGTMDLEAVDAHEKALLAHGVELLSAIDGLRLIGTAANKAGVLSFAFDDIHAHDVGTIIDQEGVACRSGHHCTQPVMDFFGVSATVRASFAAYNTHEEVERLAKALLKVKEYLG